MKDNYHPLRSLFALAPRLREASGRTLSVYLPVWSDGFDAHRYDLEIGQLVRRYEGRLGDEAQAIVNHELPRFRAHLEAVRPAACPALAGFAEESTGLLELLTLPGEADARLEAGEPLLAPVLRQLEEFPPALIAVVDKEEAKLFGAILNDMTALDHLAGMEVRHTRPGGTSAESNQRKADNRARANLEPVVRAIEQAMDSGAYRWLYLAGPDEAVSQLEHLLPAGLARWMGGRIPASLDAAELKLSLRERLKVAAKP